MAGEEGSTAVQTEMDDVSDEALAIANVDLPEDDLQPETDVALDAGHPTEDENSPDAPASETPTDDAGATGEEEAKTDKQADEKKADTDEAAEAEEKPESELDTSDIDDLLGIAETEPDNSPVWKERHSEATRTIHDQADEMSAMREALKAQGREFVMTKDGMGIAVTADAQDFDVNDIDLKAIVSSLSQDERDAIAEDPEAVVMSLARKIRGEFASRVPPITARPQDAILSETARAEEWNKFTAMTRKNGKPLYPDANNTEIVAQIERAYMALSPELQDAADRNPHVLQAVYQNCYLQVYRWQQARRALAKRQQKKVAEQDQKNKQGVAVQGSGSETSVKAQTSKSGKGRTPEEEEAYAIAMADSM